MAKPRAKSGGKKRVTVEYENLDLPPAYVESAQGMPSQQGVLHVSFFSERMAGSEELTAYATPSQDGKTFGANVGDPFGVDTNEVRVIRRVEANLIFTPEALKQLIPWLKQKLNELSHPRRDQ
ncbi:MAG: hypothetical protein OXC53_09960 [Rhodobacteraceae bacterium]|nr:hypothetical protein [Paracoccaceae bacterium]